MLRAQCNLSDVSEFKFYSLLKDIHSQDNPVPHVIESLDRSFVELLKNSVDACIKNYLVNHSSNTTLEMTVQLSFLEDRVSLRVTDNGCGFSEDYLANFADYIRTKAYKSPLKSSEKRQLVGYYFGGAGRGMSMFFNFLLDGEEMHGFGKLKQVYRIHEGSTSICIRNNFRTKGAEIILSSPLTPFDPIVCETSPFIKFSPLILQLPKHKFKRKFSGKLDEKRTDEEVTIDAVEVLPTASSARLFGRASSSHSKRFRGLKQVKEEAKIDGKHMR